jgi:heptosyltransferase III
VPLVTMAGLAVAEPIERREASWLFSAEPPPQAAAFYRGFSSIESFTGAGAVEVERNLARWSGGSSRAHPFRPSKPIHLAEHFLRSIGVARAADESIDVRLELPAEVLAAASPSLDGRRRPLLLVHPGSGGYAKRWSRGGFVQLAERWRGGGGGVVVLLGDAEESEGDAWRSTGLEVLSGIDLVAVAALLGVVDTYLGNDSGVSHLAAAVGARGVALFGPTDTRRWRPLSEKLRAMVLEPWSGADESPPPHVVDAVARSLHVPQP